MDIVKDSKVRLFFEFCMNEWERKHGRRPETREEMWDAVMDGMESRKGKWPN